MICIQSETVVSLTEAAGILPRRRAGKKPHVATLYRWSQVGCRGVKLETIQVGGTRCTSVEAMERFFSKLSIGSLPSVAPATSAGVRSTVHRELEREGL